MVVESCLRMVTPDLPEDKVPHQSCCVLDRSSVVAIGSWF